MPNTATREWLAALLAGHASTPAPALDRVRDLRRDALERAHTLTVPTTRDEEWRFTDLSPLYRMAFRAADRTTTGVRPVVIPGGMLAAEAGHRLVFVDGILDVDLSSAMAVTAAVPGLHAGSLARLDAAGAEIVRDRIATIAPFETCAFTAINTAFLHDGAFVYLARDAVVPAPIQVVHVSTQAAVATHPRTLIVAERGARATIVESFVAAGADAYCVNAVTEADIAPGADVRYVRLQEDDASAFHLSTCAARIARDGRFAANAISLGARISRNTLYLALDGPGAHCELDGLALIAGRQLADTHSTIDHRQPQCTSRQVHKCVVGGTAHAVFNGRIVVRPGAQQTDSSQQSRNLLLSPRAHVDTKPQLEILADDVKCSHGATVGQLDAEEMFYLASRGIPPQAARGLLTYGFAAEIVDRIAIPSIVQRLRQAVLDQAG